LEKITDQSGDFADFFGYSLGIESSTNRFIIGSFGAYNYIGKVTFGKY
jgi:hypothetical protein